jgi:hypothetical protein
MSTLNRYVLNRPYPEGSMIKAYTTEESVTATSGTSEMVGRLACPSLSTKVELQEGVA